MDKILCLEKEIKWLIGILETHAAVVAALEDEAEYKGEKFPDEELYDRTMTIKTLFEEEKYAEGVVRYAEYLHNEKMYMEKESIDRLQILAAHLDVTSEKIDTLISFEERASFLKNSGEWNY